MDEIILKFKCIWCSEHKRVSLKREKSLEINLDDYRVCARCKLERKHDAVPRT